MTVFVAHDIPPAIRGMLKRWFIEPKANVFVGTPNSRTREKVIQYVRRACPKLNLLVVHSSNNCQGFSLRIYGDPSRRVTVKSGLFLIAEKWATKEEEW